MGRRPTSRIRDRSIPPASVVAILSAVAGLAVVGALLAFTGALGASETSRPAASAHSPTLRMSASPARNADAQMLAGIVAPDRANLPVGVSVHRTERGREALIASDVGLADSAGLVDAVLVEFDWDADHAGDHEDLYRSFAALFRSTADARVAFENAVAHLESPGGWDLAVERRPGYDPLPLGDQSAHYVEGDDYGYPEVSVYLWRLDELVLLAVDFHPYDRPGLIGVIARDLDAAARQH